MKKIAEIRKSIYGGASFFAAMYLIGASPSLAADVSDPSSQTDSGWQIYWPTYLWVAGVNGTTRTLPPLPASEVDVSFSDSVDALKDLEAGLISTVFAHNDRLLLMGDINWMRLSPDQSVTLDNQPVKLKFFSESFTLMSAVGYRLVDDENFIVDAYVGAKLWYMDNSAEVKPAVVTPNKVDHQDTWVDGVVGGQIRSNITDHVFVSAVGFVGAGGSKFFGDVYGGVGYQFNEKWEAFAGYRAMRVERENGSFLYDITQHGPLFGVAVKF